METTTRWDESQLPTDRPAISTKQKPRSMRRPLPLGPAGGCRGVFCGARPAESHPPTQTFPRVECTPRPGVLEGDGVSLEVHANGMTRPTARGLDADPGTDPARCAPWARNGLAAPRRKRREHARGTNHGRAAGRAATEPRPGDAEERGSSRAPRRRPEGRARCEARAQNPQEPQHPGPHPWTGVQSQRERLSCRCARTRSRRLGG